ncbi:phosphopantetheine adenylyltransferase [Cricetibacter osteomyelitidis]|uniref:Phosphopantetheine adenylyltransferase n=1 Tax=Cricetibacter osteomyelitidis TaxID=1521931 RepID=A0A4R2T419_9PAST|nr:pantetheine-phosphate adenylyltransferase [Cricetibacter osteomyelitidis]TCP96036.1 phosphopantetheine adenylyltransferase [Cricetibacter osteomyelitidis]
MQTTVIYPGTFDPITNGHLDIICRAAKLFPRVLVAVASNPTKKTLFSLEERVELVKKSTALLNNVEIIGFSDLISNVVEQYNVQAIVRGVRTVADFEYELQLSHLYRHLSKNVECLFLPPSEHHSYISSTMIREITLHGGDVSGLVPQAVLDKLSNR